MPALSGQSDGLPICQTLAFNFLKPIHRAFAIRHFAAIVPVIKFRQIQRQMLFADMMERANHAAL